VSLSVRGFSSPGYRGWGSVFPWGGVGARAPHWSAQPAPTRRGGGCLRAGAAAACAQDVAGRTSGAGAAGAGAGDGYHQPVHLPPRVPLIGNVLGAGVPGRIRVGGVQGHRLRKRACRRRAAVSRGDAGPCPDRAGAARMSRSGTHPQTRTLQSDGGAAPVDARRARRVGGARRAL